MILDTDALISLMNGDPSANNAIRALEEKEDRIVTTIISAYEILRGAHISSCPERNLTKVQDVLANVHVLDLTLQACEEASKIYADLQKKGWPIGEYDVLIAGIAKAHAETILTRDKHFNLVQGISTVTW